MCAVCRGLDAERENFQRHMNNKETEVEECDQRLNDHEVNRLALLSIRSRARKKQLLMRLMTWRDVCALVYSVHCHMHSAQVLLCDCLP
jgi:hypothetical protein